MNIIKKLLYFIFICALLLGIGVFVLTHVLDPNRYKDKLAQIVHEKTGRTLLIKGNLSLSFFPWVGLRVHEVQLSNAAGFEPQDRFARIGEMDVRVALVPLLSKQIHVQGLTLSDLELNLAKNKAGLTNWQDLKNAPNTAAPTSTVSPPASTTASPSSSNSNPMTFSVERIRINDARITWNNDQTAQHEVIDHLNLDCDQPTLGQAFPVSLHFDLQKGPADSNHHFEFTSRLQIQADQTIYQLSDLVVKLTSAHQAPIAVQAETLTFNKTNQTLDLPKGLFSIGTLKGQFNAQGQALMTQPTLSGTLAIATFNPKTLLNALGKPLNTLDPNALTQLSFNAHFNADTQAFNLNTLSLLLDKTHIQGQINVHDFSAPVVGFDLALDQLDLDHYLPAHANTATIASESTQASAAKTNPTDSQTALQTSRHKPGFEGTLKANTLTVSQTPLSQVYAKMRLDQGVFTANPLNLSVYSGNTRGQVSIDFRSAQPKYTLDENITGLDLAQMTQSGRITGKMDMTAHLNLQGKDKFSLTRTLNGNLQFNVKQGALLGMDVPYQVQRAIALLKKQPAPPAPAKNQTDFDVLQGSGVFKNGVFNQTSLLAQSSEFKATGQGTADLNMQTLNYNVRIAGLHTVQNAQGAWVQEERQTPIPVVITGTFSKPVVTPDLRALIQSEVGQKVIDKVQNRLQERLGTERGGQVGNLLRQFVH